MRKAEKGFTLIELLIVTAVIGVLAVVSATIFNSILRSQNKTAITNEVRQNGNLLIDKFDRDVKQASLIELPGILLPGTSDPDPSVPNSVDLTIGFGTVTWTCNPLAGSFTRDPDGTTGSLLPSSVINDDPTNGVRVVNLAGADGCQFTVTPRSRQNTQIVTLEFSLEQRNPVQKAEFQVRVPFEVTVGTRAYH